MGKLIKRIIKWIMAIFNITNSGDGEEVLRDFRTSNINIHIDTINLKISQHQITEDQWAGIL